MNPNISLMLDKLSSLFKKKKEKVDPTPEEVAELEHQKAITQEVEAATKGRRGIHFAFPELNALYDQIKNFAFENIEGKKMLMVESLEEKGKTYTILTWAGTYRFKAPEGGGNWELYQRNWGEPGYPWVQALNIDGFHLPNMQMLPILIQKKESAFFEARDYVRNSLSELFYAAGFPSPDNRESWMKKVLEDNGFPLDNRPTWEMTLEEHGRVSQRRTMYSKLDNSLGALENILTERISGRRNKKDKRNSLKTFEMAYRGFKTRLWKMMDKKDLSNLTTMYWRDPVELGKWLNASLYNEQIETVANANRGLLPLLPAIPPESWNLESLSDSTQLATLIFGKAESEEVNQLALQKAELLLKLPVSLNSALHSAGQFNYHGTTIKPGFALVEAWQKYQLPTFVQLRLLKDLNRLEMTEVVPGTWESAPITFRTENWMKEWCESVHIMLDHHKSQTGSRSVQKYSHPIWREMIQTFNHHYFKNNGNSSPEENRDSFVDNIPLEHPWYPIVQRERLNQSLTKVCDAPVKSTKPAKRL